MLLDDARALAESGKAPRGVDNPEAYRMRSGWAFAPRSENWWEALREKREVYANLKRGETPMPMNTVS